MSLYIYAITDRLEQPLSIQSGLNGERLGQLVWRDIAAVASAYNGSQPSASPENVWRHEEVLESLMHDRAVLPARFGVLAPSLQHVGDMLDRAYPAMVRDLERVRAHVEVGVRFAMAVEAEAGEPKSGRSALHAGEPAATHCRAADPGIGPALGRRAFGAGSGSDYLRKRLAQERSLRDRQQAQLTIIREIFGLLAEQASESSLEENPDDRRRVSAAFLVPRDRLASFREAVAGAANAYPELAFLCTGPWPPYSFVTAGERRTRWSECHAG